MAVSPLPSGFLLSTRYEIIRVLGQGGFGITYLAHDDRLNSDVAIKELAPFGCVRRSDQKLEFSTFSEESASRARAAFFEECMLLQRANAPGVQRVLKVFHDNGTVYLVTEYVPNSMTLDALIRTDGPLDPTGAADILMQLAETLRAVHEKGIIHRDVKPANVLWEPGGRVILIDFGAAREWQADFSSSPTVLFSPGYAPPEQMSERGRRGPATDIYGLCATGFAILTGSAPPTAVERAAGEELPNLREVCEGVDGGLVDALVAGLRLNFNERPQSVNEWFDLLVVQPPETTPLERLQWIDDQFYRLSKLQFSRRECPQCSDVLIEPKPLAKKVCPCCHEAKIHQRNLETNLCPVCQTGRLKPYPNESPLLICPGCARGKLSQSRRLPWQSKHFVCNECSAEYEANKESVTQLGSGETMTWSQWREFSQRGSTVHICDGCQAEFDDDEFGYRLQIRPKPRQYSRLRPVEWALVAEGLRPDAGNGQCPGCFAEYFLEDKTITLLSASRDPYGFAKAYEGRCLLEEDVRYLAVGKSSGVAGLVCSNCHLELDTIGNRYQVERADSVGLRKLTEPVEFEDLHRAANGLVLREAENELVDEVPELIVESYISGQLHLDGKNPDTLWKGNAVLDEKQSQLVISESSISFGGILRKQSWDTAKVQDIIADEESLIIVMEDGELEFSIAPITLTAKLEHKSYSAQLGVEELAARLRVLFLSSL